MPEPFKNLIGPTVIRTLGELVKNAYPAFAYEKFEKTCLAPLETLELKQRAAWIGETLWADLPPDPSIAFEILRQAILPIPILEQDDSFEAWLFMPLNSILTSHGLEAVDAAIKLLPEVTKRFTAEFGIRTLIIHKPRKMFPVLRRWTKDSDPNLRRLVSEGTRPRLPWGEQIPAFIADPTPIFPLIERLKDDPSEYVRRSVANNLNDISKDNPELMLDIVEKWLSDASIHRKRLLKHACRSLVKQGHPRCLKLLGYTAPQVSVRKLSVSPAAIDLGERIEINCEIASKASVAQALVVDFRFHFVKANGQTAPKVFKGSVLSIPPKSKKSVRKQFHLKPISTRKYYTGTNMIELVINGQTFADTIFQLTVPAKNS